MGRPRVIKEAKPMVTVNTSEACKLALDAISVYGRRRLGERRLQRDTLSSDAADAYHSVWHLYEPDCSHLPP
jgi:hypothetical protein